MKWLRGWVSADEVHDEFVSLNKHNSVQNACKLCGVPLTQCHHIEKTTFWGNVKEMKQKRVLKPLILAMVTGFVLVASGLAVWSPYIIQVVKAYGVPLDANLTASILSGTNLAGNLAFLFSVKAIGKRRLFLISTAVIGLCSIGLSKDGHLKRFRKSHISNYSSHFATRRLWLCVLSTELDIV